MGCRALPAGNRCAGEQERKNARILLIIAIGRDLNVRITIPPGLQHQHTKPYTINQASMLHRVGHRSRVGSLWIARERVATRST